MISVESMKNVFESLGKVAAMIESEHGNPPEHLTRCRGETESEEAWADYISHV